MEDKKIYLPKTYDAITAINNALAGLESAFEVQSKNFEKQLAAKDSSLAQKQKELELLKSSSAKALGKMEIISKINNVLRKDEPGNNND